MNRIAVASVLLLSCSLGMAANWINLDGRGLSAQGEPLSLRIDQDSLVRNGDLVTIWMQMWWGSGGTIQHNNSTFDCKQRTSNSNAAFQEGSSGKRYEMPTKPQMTPIPPNTASEIVLDSVCSKKWFEVWKK